MVTTQKGRLSLGTVFYNCPTIQSLELTLESSSGPLALWTYSESKDGNADKKGTPPPVLMREASYELEAISWAMKKKRYSGNRSLSPSFLW